MINHFPTKRSANINWKAKMLPLSYLSCKYFQVNYKKANLSCKSDEPLL
jgi:hypothetical protein